MNKSTDTIIDDTEKPSPFYDDSSREASTRAFKDLDIIEVSPARPDGAISGSAQEETSLNKDSSTKKMVDSSADTKRKTGREGLWTKDFFIITLVNLLIFSGFQLLPSTLPLYLKDLGASDDILGWIAGVTTISALLIRPFSGLIVDRLGRKGILLISLVLMIILTFSIAFFPIVSVILFLRFAYGFGWGLTTTSVSTIATDIIPRKRFGEGMGYFSLSVSLAMAIAPGVGIAIFHSFGMTTLAFAATGVLILAFLLAIIVKSEPVKRPESQTETDKKSSKWYRQVFEKKAVFPALIIAFVTASYGSIVTFVAVYAQAQGITEIGLFFTVYAVVLLITRPFLGRAVDSKGAPSVILPGLVALLIGLVVLSFANSLALFLICAGIYGFGFGAAQSGLQTLAIGDAPAHRRGAANATFFLGFDGGLGFGAITSGIIASLLGYSPMYLVYALLPLAAGIIFLIWKRKQAAS